MARLPLDLCRCGHPRSEHVAQFHYACLGGWEGGCECRRFRLRRRARARTQCPTCGTVT